MNMKFLDIQNLIYVKNLTLIFFKNESNLIKKKYKKFILFSSSFGSDQVLDGKIYEEFIYRNLQNKSKK